MHILNPYWFKETVPSTPGTANVFTTGTSYEDTDGAPAVSISPAGQYYKNNVTHLVVYASEIGYGTKIIKSIDIWQCRSGSFTGDPDYNADNAEWWLAHTNEFGCNSSMKSDFSHSQSTFNSSNRIKVRNRANISKLNNAGWQTINFDTDFNYDGTSNLVFSFYTDSATFWAGNYRCAFGWGSKGTSRAVTYGSDSGSAPQNNAYSMNTKVTRFPLLKINYLS